MPETRQPERLALCGLFSPFVAVTLPDAGGEVGVMTEDAYTRELRASIAPKEFPR